jgi:hypothetical protein
VTQRLRWCVFAGRVVIELGDSPYGWPRAYSMTFVGAGEQGRWDFDAERFGCLQVGTAAADARWPGAISL